MEQISSMVCANADEVFAQVNRSASIARSARVYMLAKGLEGYFAKRRKTPLLEWEFLPSGITNRQRRLITNEISAYLRRDGVSRGFKRFNAGPNTQIDYYGHTDKERLLVITPFLCLNKSYYSEYEHVQAPWDICDSMNNAYKKGINEGRDSLIERYPSITNWLQNTAFALSNLEYEQ